MRKYQFVLLCFLTLCAPQLCAQYLTGRVVDQKQKAVPYATVYISELQQGVVTNEAGVFELAAPEGLYNLVVVCMGYKTTRTSWRTELTTGGQLRSITLPEAEYQIPPVYVTAKKEDPAYTIMRKAIGMAPYYRNLVQSYAAEVYIKGNLNITKLKGVVLLALDKNQRNALKNLSGVHESVNEIKYTAPDKYEQTIKSEKTAANVDLKKLGIKEDDIQLGLANLNIYSNKPNMPLAPTAFQNYTFKYLGDSQIDEQWVAKISVTPKRKSNDLFEGYLFIVREKWNVQELDLTLSTSYGKARGQQTYRFVQENVLLPVAYTVSGQFDAFGVGINGHTSGSIRYFDVVQNQRIAQNALLNDEPPKESSKESHLAQQVQELIDKPELKPKDMRELRKMQEQAVAAVRQQERKERDEKLSLEMVDNYRIIKDSARTLRDSSYWAMIRPIPLDKNELKVFELSDSIKAAPDTPEGKRRKGKEIAMGMIGSGYTFKPDSVWSISYSGLLNGLEVGYNTVDGWVYGQALRVRMETKHNGYIQLRGRASWAFCREALMWNVLAEQRYWTKKSAYWSLEVSSQSRDFADHQGVGMVNDWSSLLFRINPSRFYDGQRVHFNHRIELTHGLIWSLGLKWEDRLPLSNHNDYSWFYKKSRDFAPNVPDNNQYVDANRTLIAENRAAVIRMGLSYTPMQYYRIYEGRKTMRTSKYPTLSLEWIKGIPNVWNSQSDFDFTRIQIAQTHSFGYYNSFHFLVDAGKFLQTKHLDFADFHHLYSNQSGVSLNRGLDSFQLLSTYALSTPEWYVQAHLRYLTPYLALKYIPIFKNPLVREGIHLSYLLQPSLRHYVELGYSINNLFMMFDVGVFAGFEPARISPTGDQRFFRSWGFRLSVPIERLMNALQL